MPATLRAVMRVDDDAAALVALHAGFVETEAIGEGPPADGDEHDVGLQNLGGAARGRLDRDLQRLAALVDRGHLAGQAEGHALAGEDALRLAGHFAIEAGQDAVEEFHDRDFRSEPPPDRTEFQADDAGADDDQARRHLRQGERAGRGHDALFVDLDAAQRRHVGAGGDDDAGRLDRLALPVGADDLDLAGTGDRAGALDGIDLVLLEQEGDAGGVGFDHLILVGHHRLQIELRRADLDAEALELVPGHVEHLGRVEQRLGGDAADIEAGAAKGRHLLDDRHLEAELGGLDGADIAAGAAADDGEIVGQWLHSAWVFGLAEHIATGPRRVSASFVHGWLSLPAPGPILLRRRCA